MILTSLSRLFVANPGIPQNYQKSLELAFYADMSNRFEIRPKTIAHQARIAWKKKHRK